MRLICGPETFALRDVDGGCRVILYGQPGTADQGSAGAAAKHEVLRRRLVVAPRAWDLLSIALSVVTADFSCRRDRSPDGWTREFELDVAVADPEFWNAQVETLTRALAFLTTDIWRLRFHHGGLLPAPPRDPVKPDEDCVVLLSGGLDSLTGAIDLCESGKNPFAVSQTVRGDADKQVEFAARIGRGLNHLQLNHNAVAPGKEENSQRARSLIFMAFGVLAATTTRRYHDGAGVPLYVCENGFIAINPPLTGGRLGSLSTRTAHPEFLGRLQHLLDAAGLRVTIETPYAAKTKGELLRRCADQTTLREEAIRSTSCGRFLRHAYKHCGRCVPCQVRRAAFMAWGVRDTTEYVFRPLGRSDDDHAGFDDVRSVAMAIAAVAGEGLDQWLGSTLSSSMIADRLALRAMIGRGIDELKALHDAHGVR